jgi:hypothetical protein
MINVRKKTALRGGVGASPNEFASLPTANALLTPTKIAAELGWLNGKGNPSPQLVNKKLAELGYQIKVGDMWSATDKATNADLCDRKPVETGSKTQKDQLLWSAKVIDILSEHSVN